MWLAITVLLIIVGVLLLTREERFALPFDNPHQMQMARIRPNHCTDNCIIRSRQGTYIDGQCMNMCSEGVPTAYNVMSDCKYGWGGYPMKQCVSEDKYPQYLSQSLRGNLGAYKWGFSQ